MLRLALCVSFAVLLAPPTASAARFGELPFTPVSGAATCLRATGAPGELMRSSPTGVRFLQVTPAGAVDTGGVTTGLPEDVCPQVAVRPGGAGVVAQGGKGLWVATRDPGAGWTTPVKLGDGAARVAVAVSDAGDAVVAWLEPGSGGRFTVKAVRRAAGGAFGAPVALGTGRSATEYSLQGSVQAAIGAGGEAIVEWTQPAGTPGLLPVLAAIAPAGAAFGAPQRIGEAAATAAPVLAAAPDGRALAAFWNGKAIEVAERAPGAAFAAPATVATADDPYATMPALAIGPGGAAVVAWQSLLSQGVSAVSRPAAGAFGPPTVLARDIRSSSFIDTLRSFLALFGLTESGPLGIDGATPDSDGGNLRAALTADGRALLTWTDAARTLSPRAATFPLAGGHVDSGPVGSGLRRPSSITPLALAGGAAAVAWSDNRDGGGGGRVHVAPEGNVPAAGPAPPRIALGAPLDAVLKPKQSLELPVSCSAACELRVDLPGHLGAVQFVSLARKGTRTVEFEPDFEPLVPLRREPVRVRLRFSAPGAAVATERIETVTARRLPSPPTPHVRGLKAVRHGSAVDVSWRTDIATRADRFLLIGSAGREIGSDPLTGGDARSAGTRRFTAHLPKAAKVRFVALFIANDFTFEPPIVVQVG